MSALAVMEIRSLPTWTGGLPGSSHAEAALASRGDVGVLSNVGIVQQVSKGHEIWFWSLNLSYLVGGSRTEKCGCGSNEDGKQDAGDDFLHDGDAFRLELRLLQVVTQDTVLLYGPNVSWIRAQIYWCHQVPGISYTILGATYTHECSQIPSLRTK